MDIEEAIKILKKWADDDRVIRNNSLESDFDKFCEEKNIAIDTVLKELDKYQEEHEILLNEIKELKNK